MKTIRINRAKWLTGRDINGGIDSKLYDCYLDKGCCLGHAIHQTNKCSWMDLDGKGSPEDYYKKETFLTKIEKEIWGEESVDNKFSTKAMAINDSLTLSDKEREKKLIALFKDYGLKLVFYGKYEELETV